MNTVDSGRSAGWAQRWRDLRIGVRIAVGFSVLTLFTALMAWAGWNGVRQLSDAITYVTGPAWSTADGAMEGVIGIEKQMLAVERFATGTSDVAAARTLLDEGTAMADDALGRVGTSGLIAPERYAEMVALRSRFDAARSTVWKAAERRDVSAPLLANYRAAADALLEDIDELEELGDSQVEGYITTAEAVVQSAYTELAIGVLAALVIGVLAARTIIVSVTRPLAAAVGVANRVSAGKLDEAVQVESRDETGELLAALRTMQGELRERIEREATQAEHVRKIQAAMDQASAAMMLVDTSDCILFANHSMRSLASTIGARDGFDGPVDRILQGADTAPTMATLRESRTLECRFGSAIVALRASPVRNDAGADIGTVLEWTELTAQRNAERELARVLEDAKHGRLHSRLDVSVMHGVMGELGRSVNAMLDAIVEPLAETTEYLARLSRGDIPTLRQGRFEGDFAQIESALRRCMDAIGVLVRDTQRLGEAAARGDLAERADLGVHEGDYRRIVESINSTLDAIATPVKETQKVMRTLAEGDLTREMSGKYHGEFAQMQESVNGSIRQLRTLLENILAGADLIGASSAEIRNGNMDLSMRTERQANSVQQTTGSMGELTDMVRRNTEQARHANDMAAGAAQAARTGGEVVGRAVRAMSEIDRTSKEIADIIGVVDEIAFQTNLLALNASVEAARAGEQGRGFAVVAGEVRNLAQRSAGAARQIKELINASVARVDEGAELVRASGTTLEHIVESVGAVSNIVSGIADASEAQYAGIRKIGDTLNEIDQGTQQNAAMVEEVAAASTTMDDQAAALRERVATFRTRR